MSVSRGGQASPRLPIIAREELCGFSGRGSYPWCPFSVAMCYHSPYERPVL